MAADEIDDRDETWREVLWKVVVDYGPPYEPGNPEEVPPYILVSECSEYDCNLYRLNNWLNKRLDPNERDPEDLYYTPMHWCVRNCHLQALKMLHKAGANLNLLNELGQSLLGMACMLHFAADKFDDNVRMVKFLVENGALIEHRDKAGYAPLDYAARNNNTALIRLLLDNGADVGRNNKLLVAPREDILTHVTDPDCYRLLMIKVKAHKMREKREQDRIDEIRRDEEEKEKIRKEIERFDARRAKNRQEKHRLAGEAYHKGKAEEVAEKMRLDLKTMMGKDSGDSLYKYGHWERGQSGHWDWKKTQLAVKHEDVYAEGLSTITKIRDKYKFETFNNRWKSITDGHELEVKWTKSDAFEEIEQASLTKSKKIDKFRLEEKNEPLSTNDIDYRDENDDLLQDVDMSDLMDALCK